MNPRDPEDYVKHYLPRLGVDEDAYFALIEPREGIAPLLASACRAEHDPRKKLQLLEVLWQHRTPAVIPVLAEALADRDPGVWKEALNGLVALEFPRCLAVLEVARDSTVDRNKAAWIQEAMDQLRHGFSARPDGTGE